MDFEDSFLAEQDFEDTELMQEVKEGSKRGRKPGRRSTMDKMDAKSRLERSRQSARECRARKKLRYQYLEELVTDREKAIISLRKELEKYRNWNKEIDEGNVPNGYQQLLEEFGAIKKENTTSYLTI